MRPLRSACLVCLAAAGCGGSANGTDLDGPITYLPGGGFTGQGDGSTELLVELDGTVQRPTPSGGSQTATLPPATLDDLHRKIRDADFPSLEVIYTCGCADDYVYAVGVQLGGQQYVVTAHEMAPPPPKLQLVIDAFHELSELPLDWH